MFGICEEELNEPDKICSYYTDNDQQGARGTVAVHSLYIIENMVFFFFFTLFLFWPNG